MKTEVLKRIDKCSALSSQFSKKVFANGKPGNYIPGGTIILIWILITAALLLKFIN